MSSRSSWCSSTTSTCCTSSARTRSSTAAVTAKFPTVRVLITGVSGFAGHHLAALCANEGAPVIGAGRRKAPVGSGEYVRADLADRVQAEALVRSAAPDWVFHLAAEASVPHSWQDPAGVIESNVASTLNLLDTVRQETPSARVLV